MDIMKCHRGLNYLISGERLYKKTGMKQRATYRLMTHLIFVHNQPIITIQNSKSHGYCLARTKTERDLFRAIFTKRAITGIDRISKILKLPALPSAVHVAISQITSSGGKKIPGLAHTIKQLMDIIEANPQLYADERQEIQEHIGQILVSQDKMNKIRALTEELNQLTGPDPGSPRGHEYRDNPGV